MLVPEYQDRPITVTSDFNTECLKGKSVIITGGASGLGKAYAKAFVEAGAYVTIGDRNESLGTRVASELGGNAQFVVCDVRCWDDQVALFETAMSNSPNQSVDIAIANAGIGSDSDKLCRLDDTSNPPVKPDLTVLDINQTGVLYTSHLALHYFRASGGPSKPEPSIEERGDKCLIIVSSFAAYFDRTSGWQYCVSKDSGRCLMRNMRRVVSKQGIRVNLITPTFIDTPILGEKLKAALLPFKDELFGLKEDAVKAVFKICTDTSVNGRSLGIVPRSMNSDGYIDVEHDDFHDGDPFKEIQEQQLGREAAMGRLVKQL